MCYIYARVNSIAASKRKAKLNSFFPTNSKTIGEKEPPWKKCERARPISLPLSLSHSVCVLRCARRELLLSESTDETCVTRAKREEKNNNLCSLFLLQNLGFRV